MKNIATIWNGLTNGRKMALLVALAATFIGVLAIGALGTTKRTELLYSGLDAAAAGEVVAALDARNIVYEVKGGAIYVDSMERDRLRMSLAAEGLPAVGAKGYELLDNLSGFGTTSQMFDAAYWRAKEGELARTIVAAPHIRSARVHLSPANTRPFQRGGQARAAVTVSTTTGTLSRDQANALRHLLAASIDSLPIANVSVIDDVAGLIASGESDSANMASDEMGERIRHRVERLLSARVGSGNAVVEVAIDRVTQRETVIERLIDPESQVAISAESEKRSETSAGGDAGVTVASNLPDGEGAGPAGSESSSTNETRERKNYEISETQREIKRDPGDVKRLTVAVLLNHVTETSADGATQTVPRAEEEIAALKSLVASAVGFDEARGDVITIETMPFVQSADGSAVLGTSATSSLALDIMGIIQMLIIAAVVLILGLFVLKPILTSIPRRSGAGETLELTANVTETADTPSESADSSLPDLSDGFATMGEPLDFGGFDTSTDFGGDSPVSRLKTLIAERQEESIQLLQSWIDPPVDASKEAK